MTNPYETPSADFSDAGARLSLPPAQQPGLVSHVRVVAILMIVQGILDIVMSLLLGGMAALFPFFQSITGQPMPQGQGMSPEALGWMMVIVYGGIAVLHLFPGALLIFAAYRGFSFKGRTLGIVALSAGLTTFFGCYCLPTSVALAIYGLIVYLNPSVAQAFLMGEQGYPADAIQVTFSRFRTWVQPPPTAAANPMPNGERAPDAEP